MYPDWIKNVVKEAHNGNRVVLECGSPEKAKEIRGLVHWCVRVEMVDNVKFRRAGGVLEVYPRWFSEPGRQQGEVLYFTV